MSDRAVAPDPASHAAPPPPAARRWADLLPRLLSALVLGVLALGADIAGGHVFLLFWLLAAAAVLWEWQHLLGPERAGLRFAVGAVSLSVAVPLVEAGAVLPAGCAVAAGVLGTALAAPPSMRVASPLGLLYAAALAVAVTLLRRSPFDGVWAILWLFAVVWGTDVMGYFGGRLVGGPKLSPRFSPAKTWSGFLIGIGAGACLGLAVAPAQSDRLAILVLGLATGAVAQAGDIFESALKRRYGVKDSGRLIPGHGGVMDRLDGFLTAAVFAAVVGTARSGLDAVGSGLLHW